MNSIAERLEHIAKAPAAIDAAIQRFIIERNKHPMHRDAALRDGFDPDLGAYTGHPDDPRAETIAEFIGDAPLTLQDATDEAAEQVLSHSESVADWMAKACDCDAGREPLDVRALEPVQIIEGAVPMLLAVLMNGDNTQALRALHRLRELAAAEFKSEIDQRAAAILEAA